LDRAKKEHDVRQNVKRMLEEQGVLHQELLELSHSCRVAESELEEQEHAIGTVQATLDLLDDHSTIVQAALQCARGVARTGTSPRAKAGNSAISSPARLRQTSGRNIAGMAAEARLEVLGEDVDPREDHWSVLFKERERGGYSKDDLAAQAEGLKHLENEEERLQNAVSALEEAMAKRVKDLLQFAEHEAEFSGPLAPSRQQELKDGQHQVHKEVGLLVKEVKHLQTLSPAFKEHTPEAEKSMEANFDFRRDEVDSCKAYIAARAKVSLSSEAALPVAQQKVRQALELEMENREIVQLLEELAPETEDFMQDHHSLWKQANKRVPTLKDNDILQRKKLFQQHRAIRKQARELAFLRSKIPRPDTASVEAPDENMDEAMVDSLLDLPAEKPAVHRFLPPAEGPVLE